MEVEDDYVFPDWSLLGQCTVDVIFWNSRCGARYTVEKAPPAPLPAPRHLCKCSKLRSFFAVTSCLLPASPRLALGNCGNSVCF